MHSNLLHGIIKPLHQGDPTISSVKGNLTSEAQRLRLQMQADALQPLSEDPGNDGVKSSLSAVSAVDQYSPDMLEEASQFLRLQVSPIHLLLTLFRFRNKWKKRF